MKTIQGYITFLFTILCLLGFQNIIKGQTIDESRATWKSAVINFQTPGQSTSADVDITNASKFYLVVTDAGDGNGCDHADWIAPVIINGADTVKLTCLTWVRATSGWNTTIINKSISGGSLIVNNITYPDGIGTHANSIIEYNLPAGYKRFKAICGLDKAGVTQGCGSTVKFMVFTQSLVDTIPPKYSNIIDGEIISPDQKIKVVLKMKTLPVRDSAQVGFNIFCKNDTGYDEVLPNSPMGISRSDGQFIRGLKLVEASSPTEIHDSYEMVSGKRKACENFGTERVFKFVNSNKQPVNIVVRAYNNGIAFRYVFPNSLQTTKNIIDEATAYVLPANTNRWMQPFNKSYEEFFPKNTTGICANTNQEWGYPALYKVNDKPYWVLISEADISRNNCATKLCNIDISTEYKVKMPSDAVTTLPWNSPWRTLMIGSLSDIVESTLISDVSVPNKLTDTSWIKPGPASWVYWANNHGSKDYAVVVQYIDLAVEMKWPYVLIDWEWDVMSNGGTITDAANYANSKGIKPLMWYNSGTDWLGPTPVDRLLTPQKRATEFAWLNSIGVYGIKVDFFAGDQQDMMKYYIDILEDAAKYHLMVDFHGATLPRGWSRTYPNLITTEAVYGAEYYNNGPTLTNMAASHNTTLPFTRNVVGSMDYTPVTFSNSQYPHITSYGHELALSVVFESGLQCFADRPTAYKALPAIPKDFLKSVPVSWDDTKLIDGYPGEKVVIARKKANKWYIGGLNGKDVAQTLSLNLSFLGEGNYSLLLIKDGVTNKSFKADTISVKNTDIVNVPCLIRGGFVGVISPDSSINSVKTVIEKSTLVNIYPNPASEKVIVEVLDNSGQKADLFDNNGRKITTYNITDNKAVVNVAGLSCGCYYISVHLKNIDENKKFTIVR